MCCSITLSWYDVVWKVKCMLQYECWFGMHVPGKSTTLLFVIKLCVKSSTFIPNIVVHVWSYPFFFFFLTQTSSFITCWKYRYNAKRWNRWSQESSLYLSAQAQHITDEEIWGLEDGLLCFWMVLALDLKSNRSYQICFKTWNTAPSFQSYRRVSAPILFVLESTFCSSYLNIPWICNDVRLELIAKGKARNSCLVLLTLTFVVYNTMELPILCWNCPVGGRLSNLFF